MDGNETTPAVDTVRPLPARPLPLHLQFALPDLTCKHICPFSRRVGLKNATAPGCMAGRGTHCRKPNQSGGVTMFHRVTIIGFVGQDPQMRYTARRHAGHQLFGRHPPGRVQGARRPAAPRLEGVPQRQELGADHLVPGDLLAQAGRGGEPVPGEGLAGVRRGRAARATPRTAARTRASGRGTTASTGPATR